MTRGRGLHGTWRASPHRLREITQSKTRRLCGIFTARYDDGDTEMASPDVLFSMGAPRNKSDERDGRGAPGPQHQVGRVASASPRIYLTETLTWQNQPGTRCRLRWCIREAHARHCKLVQTPGPYNLDRHTIRRRTRSPSMSPLSSTRFTIGIYCTCCWTPHAITRCSIPARPVFPSSTGYR